jgi:alkylation response protein AidB-like acyl-CoA dehydrogenase|tara:strand:- start:2576 stop:3715 length:1140 start_codon:yes stop_codon:yes gene_type:complete
MSLDLNLTEDEEVLRKTALDFLRRDAPKDVVQQLQETDTGVTEELWRKAVELGWLGIIIPEQYGGTGFPLTSAGVLFEALGGGPLPGPYFSSGILSSLILLQAGSEEQKQQILPAIAKGEQILTLALTEPEYSWDPELIETTAKSVNGDYVVDGVKLFTMDAEAATQFIVAARTQEGSHSSNGISLFLVDRQSDGVSVSRQPGFLSGRAFEVRLDAVKVPSGAVLGDTDDGWLPLTQAFDKAIPILCANKAGGSQAVIEMTLEYSRVRVQFGQPIGRFQRVQDMIIDMVTHADAARWATYEALWKLDTEAPASASVHLAKVLSSQSYWEVCTLGHQVFSGVGYSRESPLSFHTRASRSLYHFLGEPSYHRQQLAQLLTA